MIDGSENRFRPGSRNSSGPRGPRPEPGGKPTENGKAVKPGSSDRRAVEHDPVTGIDANAPRDDRLPDLFTEVGGGQPVRYIVDVEGGEVIEKRQIDYRLAPDFAAVDSGRAMLPCDDFWMLGISAAGHSGRKFFDQLVRADWSNPGLLDVYQAPENHYLGGEPVFICDPNDDRSGAIICQLFDAELVTSAFAIFDAFDVGRGPQALLYLRNPVRLGFHAVFSAVS